MRPVHDGRPTTLSSTQGLSCLCSLSPKPLTASPPPLRSWRRPRSWPTTSTPVESRKPLWPRFSSLGGHSPCGKRQTSKWAADHFGELWRTSPAGATPNFQPLIANTATWVTSPGPCCLNRNHGVAGVLASHLKFNSHSGKFPPPAVLPARLL